MKSLLEYSAASGISIKSIVEDKEQFLKYIYSYNVSSKLQGISSVLGILIRLGESITGYSVFEESTLKKLRKEVKAKKKNQQTAVIPNRLLTHCIKQNDMILEEFNSSSEKIHKFLENVKAERGYALSYSSQKTILGKKLSNIILSFEDAVTQHDLEDLCRRHGVTDLTGFARYLHTVQYSSKTIIHAYSGMSDSEVLSLPYDCLQQEQYDNRMIYRLHGATTKRVGTKAIVSWITSKNSEKAVKAAQRIVDLFCIFGKKKDDRLFLSGSTIKWSSKSIPPIKKFKAFSIQAIHKPDIISIKESDVEELELVTPLRDWRSDDRYNIGRGWPFSSHQFRRSLAFYAAQSGLVSLPSLKRQLKHITLEMSVFYASGASAPRSMFTNKKGHILDEYREVKPEADVTAILLNLLLSDKQLHGPMGKVLDKKVKSKGIVVILKSRKSMEDDARRGLIAFTDTPIGACLSTEPCNERAMRSLIACGSCPKAVIIEDECREVVREQAVVIDSLDPSSMEYKMETTQLSSLKEMLKHIERDKK